MEIITAVASYADAVAELHTASWRTAYAHLFPAPYLNGPLPAEHRQLWRARLDQPAPDAALFLAVETGVLRGFAYMEPQPDGRVLLDNLHARPGHTGRGLGSRLLQHALTWSSTAHPGRDVYVEVLRGNNRAIAFYQRHQARHTASRTCRSAGGRGAAGAVAGQVYSSSGSSIPCWNVALAMPTGRLPAHRRTEAR
ncbi:GNAT family N-acetyltransferase [Streptomyces olindensis]|uniref:GNAT family N-acetyltransferase n=1 Tax=Streptomyces olindensis TaxID=358823 RepID=A0ABV2XVW9_9ACTN